MSSNASIISASTTPATRSSASDDNSSTATVDKINAFEVYAPETKMIYTVPRRNIIHFGTNSSGKLLLCKTFSSNPTATPVCPEGGLCRYVHINVPLNQLKGDIIHVHYIYRDAALCPYERLSTAAAAKYPNLDKFTALTIFGPHQQRPAESLTPNRIITTEGALKALAAIVQGVPESVVPCHCAHYYYAQTCNRGASCSFIHVVSVDPSQERDSTRPATYRKRMQATSEAGLWWSHLTFNPQSAASECSMENSTHSTRTSIRQPSFVMNKGEAMSPTRLMASPATPSVGLQLIPHTRMLSTSSELTLDAWGEGRDGVIFRQDSFQPNTPDSKMPIHKFLAIPSPTVEVLSVPMNQLCEAETSNRSVSVSRCATPAYQPLAAKTPPTRFVHNPYIGSKHCSPCATPATASAL